MCLRVSYKKKYEEKNFSHDRFLHWATGLYKVHNGALKREKSRTGQTVLANKPTS
jgi:hypothetical protein